MSDLVSPGVSVTVTNESFYASAPTGTVPLIVIATAQDKLQPGTSSVAQNTTKATAGQLQLVTSQRDVLQMYGAPNFYSVGGTPQYDNELNELGLFSLYEFLGIANNAYVIRADIDLAQLEPSAVAPTGSAQNGSYWLDTSQSTWGTFVSNGDQNPAFAWAAVAPMVITDASLMENVVQGQASPKITSGSANGIVSSSTLNINGVDISLDATMTLTDISNAINGNLSLQLLSISAQVFSHNETMGSNNNEVVPVYNLRLTGGDIYNNIDLSNNSDSNLMTSLGLSNTALNVAAPLASMGSAGDLAVDTVSISPDGTRKNRIWEKVSVATVDPVGGNTTKNWWFAVGTTTATTLSYGTNTSNVFAGWNWLASEPVVVVGSTASTPVMNTGAIPATITINGTALSVAPTDTTLASFVANINAQFSTYNLNANADVYTSGINSQLRITNYDGTAIKFYDSFNPSGNVKGIWTTVGIDTSQTYFGSVAATVATPTFTAGDSFTVDIGGGAQTITVLAGPNNAIGNVAAQINTAVGATIATAPGNYLTLSRAGTYIKLQEVHGAPLTGAGIGVGYKYGRTAFFKDYYNASATPAFTVPSLPTELAAKSIWVNTTSQNRGASTQVKQYVNGTWVTQNTVPNTGTIPWLKDINTANLSFGARKNNGSLFMCYNLDDAASTSDNAIPTEMTMELLRWHGSAWSTAGLMADQTWNYTPGTTAPQGAPADGTLWYNTQLVADVMVGTGQQWKGYKNVYPGTDPNGIIVSGSAPLTQSTGNDLADYDLWLDSSATTYPVISRYIATSQSWIQIDNTDHVTSAGIIFEDARSNAGSNYNYSTMSDVLAASDQVDSDAPDAELYPAGMLLFNTRYSTNNVKEWSANYFGAGKGTWVTASGNNPGDFTPYMGHAAQRIMIVNAMQGALQASEDARAEAVYFNLLAAPGYPECIDEMVTLNTDKKEIAFVVGDTPAHLPPTGTAIVNWATNAANAYDNGDAGLITRNDYVGVWYPWALSTNLDGSYVFVPPSMMALRTIAFNDQVAYPWFAPAGFNRGLVTGVNSVGYLNSIGEYKPQTLNQGQRDTLYTNNINPIAYIPNRGLVIYGQKTLSPTASALDRINVARLVNYLKYQLDNVAKAFLFEPNDKQTRDAVLTTFNGFFNNLVGLRALYDFAVVCDETNNTPARIDANQLWIDVAIKPEKAIEFIYIPIRLLNTGDPLPNGTR